VQVLKLISDDLAQDYTRFFISLGQEGVFPPSKTTGSTCRSIDSQWYVYCQENAKTNVETLQVDGDSYDHQNLKTSGTTLTKLYQSNSPFLTSEVHPRRSSRAHSVHAHRHYHPGKAPSVWRTVISGSGALRLRA
jgi:hypothetical protein